MRRKTALLVAASAAVVLAVAGGVTAFALRDGGGDPGDGRGDADRPGAGEQDEAPAPAGPQPAVETVADGFDQPWGLAFLPGTGGELLVTQLPGTLSVLDTATGEAREVTGVPEVRAEGQGGLLDVAVHPDFPESRWVYLTYAGGDGDGASATHLARARLDAERTQLEDLEVLLVAEPFRQGTAHYGSRLAFGADGNLFMTVGDRADKNFADHPAQDRSTLLGTTVRLAPDGSVPGDNPFVSDPGVADEIWSYGHRNVQGMAVHPETGAVWQSEHGEEDGDKIQVLRAGGDYGWPEATTACEYGTDTPLGDDPYARDDVVDPVYAWECGTGGFPPAGMAFYHGDAFPAWRGDLLLGGLASRHLVRFPVEDAGADTGEEAAGGVVGEPEPLLTDEGWRIRSVAVGPHDGAVYLTVDAEDAPVVRLVGSSTD